MVHGFRLTGDIFTLKLAFSCGSFYKRRNILAVNLRLSSLVGYVSEIFLINGQPKLSASGALIICITCGLFRLLLVVPLLRGLVLTWMQRLQTELPYLRALGRAFFEKKVRCGIGSALTLYAHETGQLRHFYEVCVRCATVKLQVLSRNLSIEQVIRGLRRPTPKVKLNVRPRVDNDVM